MSVSPQSRIEPYLRRLYGYAFSLTQDSEQSRVLVQDCAVRALSARRVPADESAYRVWLFRILRNRFIDHLRQNRKFVPWDQELEKELPNMEYRVGDERLINTLSVQQGLQKLTRSQREIIGLIDISGYAYAEAAQLLGVPKGTIMSRISRARAALLNYLSSSNIQLLADRNKVPGR